MFYGVAIRYILENYIMLSIAYAIKMYALSIDSISETLTSAFSIAVVLMLLAMPLLTRAFLYK